MTKILPDTTIKRDRAKETLQKLKEQERKPMPKIDKEISDFKAKRQEQSASQSQVKPTSSFYQQRLDRIISKLNDLEKKMKEGKDYFTAWWDYQKVSKEFLLALDEFERFEKAFVPKAFQEKLNTTKIKVDQALERAKKQPDNNTPASDML